MQKIMQKLQVSATVLVGAVVLLALVLIPRVGNFSRAESCENPPQTAQLNPYPISESGTGCTDRNFVAVATSGSSSWQSSVSADYGQEVTVRVYVHNGASQAVELEPGNIAQNVSVQSSISGNGVSVSASGSNTNSLSGFANINLPAGATLSFVDGSAQVFDWQMNQISSGMNPSYVSLGDMRACFEHLRFVSFKVRVSAPPVQATPTGTISANRTGGVSAQCLYTAQVVWSTQNASNVQVRVTDLSTGETNLYAGAENGNDTAPWISPNTTYRFTLFSGSTELAHADVTGGDTCNTPVEPQSFDFSASSACANSQQVRFTITNATAGLRGKTISWSSTKNGVDTGETGSNYGQAIDGNGNWSDAVVYNSSMIGAWTKTATVDGVSRTDNFTVSDCTPAQVLCPSGAVSVNPSSITVGSYANAFAPSGWYNGSFSSSNSAIASVSGQSVRGVAAGTASISGSGWTAPNGATNCALQPGTVTVTTVIVPPADDVICSPSSQNAQVGQTVYLSASRGNGSYSWSANGASNTSGAGSFFSTSYNTSGSKSITVSSNGKTASCTVNVETPAQVLCPSGAVSVNPSSITVGSYANAFAPSGWYNGSFSSSNSAIASVSGQSVRGVAAGTASISGSGWTAPNGATNCALQPGTVTVTTVIVPPADDVICSPSSQNAQVGQTVYLSASRGNGSYSWSANGASNTSGAGSFFSTSYNTSGSKSITVSSNGKTASCTVNVETPAQVLCPSGAVSVNPSSITVGSYANAFAPSGWYNGSFSSSNSAIASVSGQSVRGVAAGTASISGSGWTAPNGATNCALQPGTVTVTTVIVPPADDVICSPSSQNAQVGQTVYLSASRGNGSYSWSANGASNTSGAGSFFSTSYNTSGSKSITVSSNGKTASCTVNVADVQIPTLSCNPPSQTAGIQQNVYFSATGGNGSYTWSAPSANQPSGSGQSYYTAFGTSGGKTVTVTSGGQTASCNVTINAAPVQDVFCSPATQTVDINQTFNLSATQGNGSFAWTAPGAQVTTASGQNFSSSYSTSGTKYVTVSSGGRSASCTVSVREPVQVCTPNSGMNLTASAITGSSAPYSTQISWSFSGTNAVRITYVDPTSGQEVNFAGPVTQTSGSQNFSSIQPNQNYIFRLYDTASCGGLRQTVVVRKDVSTTCVANTNATLTASTPVKSGSTYSSTLTWNSNGSNGTKLTQGGVSNVVATSNSGSGSYTAAGMQAGNSYTFYLSDSNCGGLLTATTIVVAAETTTGGSYYNYQNCLYNSCNTYTYTSYTTNPAPSNEYRSLTLEKQVRNLYGASSFSQSVSSNINDTVEFQIVVRNSGNAQVNNVRVTDAMPSGLSLVGGSVRVDGAYSSDSVLNSSSAYLGNLTVGQSKTITFQARVNSFQGSNIQNVAFATGDSVSQVQDDAWVFTQGQVQGGSVNLTYSKRATNDTKNADAQSVNASKEDYITYTLTVTNNGNQPATNFSVTDDLSQVLPYADVVDAGSGTVSGNVITFPGLSVPANGSVSRSFRVRVKYFLADDLSYTMTNTYGNTVTVRINTPRVAGAFVAPKTGAETAAFGFASVVTAAFGTFRRRKDIMKFIFNA